MRTLSNPLGPAKGDDPSARPPLPGWKPHPDREWALAYVNDDGSEDFEGFQREFMQRYAALFSGNVISYMPPNVDYFLRRTSNGHRVDIDHELTRLPRSKEDIAADEEIRNAHLRQRRQDLLDQRRREAGIKYTPTPDDPERPPVEPAFAGIVSICGDTETATGNPFNEVTIKTHEARCKRCLQVQEEQASIAQENLAPS